MDTQVEARFFQCPVDAGLALMAGKWKPRLLWKLYRYQTMRFGQFKRMLPDITDKMLTQQFGKTLEPVIAAIATWGETHEQEIRSHLESHDVALQEQSS